MSSVTVTIGVMLRGDRRSMLPCRNAGDQDLRQPLYGQNYAWAWRF